MSEIGLLLAMQVFLFWGAVAFLLFPAWLIKRYIFD